MSRSGEARKPRAESRVKVLADENAALRADRSSLETRVKELRAELDAATRLHREVRTRLEETKARLEGENAGIQGRLNERDRAALKLTGQLIEANETNTRLLGCIAAVWCPACTGRVWMQGGGPNDRGPTVLSMHMRRTGPRSRCGASGKTLAEVMAATSDKSPNCKPTRICEKCGSAGDCLPSCDGKMVSPEGP